MADLAPVAFPSLNNKEALCVWHSEKERIQRDREGDRQTLNERARAADINRREGERERE